MKLFIYLFLLCCFTSYGQGSFLIYPKRLVFEGAEKRVETLRLVNPGSDSTTYRISYIEARMNEQGKMETIETPEPGQHFAKPFLRFYPRQVTIAPNQSQVIKVQLININRLSAGEYRSHLYVRAVPKQEVLKPATTSDKTEKNGVNIALKPIYGYAIPNIIQIGTPQVEVDFANLMLKDLEEGSAQLQFDILRTGNMSAYGDISVIHHSVSGAMTPVGEVKGVAIYAPGALRKFSIDLNRPEGVDYSSGFLSIKYEGINPEKEVLSEATLQL